MKRDSSSIFCNIIKEDSTTLYYRQTIGEQTFELNIKKTAVLNYYSRRANAIAELRRADSLAQARPNRDSIHAKNDSLQKTVSALTLKKDSVRPKKDTLPLKAVALKSQSDSIFLNSNYKCFYQGEVITKRDALDFMKRDTTARKEMKLARGYFAPVIPLGLGALVLAGVFVYDAVGPGDFHWVIGGGCIIAAAMAITFKHYSNVHVYKAVKLYNANRDIAVVNMPKFELGVASKGVGLCLKF